MNDLFTTAIAPNITHPLTIETMMVAIEALKRDSLFPKGHPFHGVTEAKECAALKGMQTVIINGETLYYWLDAFEAKEVKVLRLPKMPEPEFKFSWSFEASNNFELL